MKDLKSKEKILLISFIFMSIFILWLISPMGQLFLPVDKSNLEQSLSFDLPEDFKLKQYLDEYYAQLFHLTNEKSPSQITTIIIEKEKYIEEASDKEYSSAKANAVNEFLITSGLSDTQISSCKEENVITCKFKAKKEELNDLTYKEGEVIFLTKKGKPVTILSVATEMAYDSKLSKTLVEKILK